MFADLRFRLGKLLGRVGAEGELDRELRGHLEREIEESVRRGLSPEEARRQAHLDFGGVERAKEECRDSWGTRFLDVLAADLRLAARNLRRRPGFALLCVFTLALGIGVNTALFSVVYGVLLSALPYGGGDRLVLLRHGAASDSVGQMPFSVKDIADYKAQSQTLEEVVEYHQMSFILLGRPEAEQVRTGVVSANFFDVLGVRPLYGRTFLTGEDQHGAAPVLVLSYRYFLNSHGGDTAVIGRSFRLNDRAHIVVGVLPPLPAYPEENDVYMPASACPFRSNPDRMADRNSRMMSVFARLKPGAGFRQAQGDVSAIAARLAREFPDSYPAGGYGSHLALLREELTRRAQPTFLMLLAASGLVLLIACANVANLMLCRLLERDREMAIRAALGASPMRLWRQLVTESTLLALAGGAAGLAIAWTARDLLVAYAARFTPRAEEIRVDAAVLLFTLLISVLTGIVFGSVPALAWRKRVGTVVRDSGAQMSDSVGRRKLRQLLVVSQVAVAFVLLTGAGLMIRSAVNVARVDPGFRPERVLTMNVTVNWSRYTEARQVREFFHVLLTCSQALPGVVSAALAFRFPLDQAAPWARGFLIEGRQIPERAQPKADFRAASAQYFQTIGVPLLRGRFFTDQDHEQAPQVAMVNQSMALRHWSGEDPVGRRISFNGGKTWATIVGVVGDVRQYGLDQAAGDGIYLCIPQVTVAGTLVVRTAGEPARVEAALRRLVREIDPENPVSGVTTLEQARSENLAPRRLTTLLFALLAVLTVVIAISGLGGLMALSVRQRASEIGVRMTLGATPERVLSLVLRQGLALVMLGLALGAAGALVLSRLAAAFLFGVEATDPATYLISSALFLAAATAACWLPARRAAALDPLLVLRTG